MTTPKQAAAALDSGLVFLVICAALAVVFAMAFGGLA
jgi:hypothetical protein